MNRYARVVAAVWLAAATGSCDLDLDFDIDLSGMFADRCGSDDSCPAETICTGGWGLHCEPAKLCSADGDCAPAEPCRLREPHDGEQATRRTCEPRLCQCDDDCPSELVCNGGSRSSPDRCVDGDPICASDQECATEQHCAARDSSGCAAALMKRSCRPRPCECDADCPPGTLCSHGGCEAAERLCEQDTDCAAAERCRLRAAASCPEPANDLTTCEPWPCTCDEACPPDFVCAGEHGTECIRGERCVEDYDCPEGQRCYSVANSHCDHEQSTRMCVVP